MRTSYYELVVRGNETLLKGFLWGFKAAKNIKRGLVFCGDHPIETHHLKEILTFHGDYVHLVASGRYHRSLVSALERAAELDFEIVSDRPVTNAWFEFEFETFSKDVAPKLKRVLGRIPSDLALVDYEPEETVDPSARGVEMYSPMHEYRFRGSGKVEGNLEKLLGFHEQLKEHVFIETKNIELEHRD